METPARTAADARTVFVVHGRDQQARDAIFAFLRSINLKPLEWTTAIGLTGVASPYIGEVLDAAFANAQAIVVLMTPDDIAYLSRDLIGPGDNSDEVRPSGQARPNVLFEAGMAMGRAPARTVLVQCGDLRPFSDIGGRHALRWDNTPEGRAELAARLRRAGCDVDTDGIDWLRTGTVRFRSPAVSLVNDRGSIPGKSDPDSDTDAVSGGYRCEYYPSLTMITSGGRPFSPFRRNERFHVSVKFKNTGTLSWVRDGYGSVRLGTSHPRDRWSKIGVPSWFSVNRPAVVNEAVVIPGEYGTFEFDSQIPSGTEVTMVEHFNLVAEYVVWFPGEGCKLTFDVTE